MRAFRFPQPGELQNGAAVPVPVHTLRALLAGALAWEIDTEASHPGILPPQLRDATCAALSYLSDADAQAAALVSERLMWEKLEAEHGP